MPIPLGNLRAKNANVADPRSNPTPPSASERAGQASQLQPVGWLRVIRSEPPKRAGILLGILALLTAGAIAYGAGKLLWTTPVAAKAGPPATKSLDVKLVDGKPNSLLVPEAARTSLGISKARRRPNRSRHAADPRAAPGDARLNGPRSRPLDPHPRPFHAGRSGGDRQDRRSPRLSRRDFAGPPRLAGRRPGEEG